LSADSILQKYKLIVDSNILGSNQGWVEDGAEASIPITTFNEIENQVILILQRGVDPYSPTLTNQYGIGKIMG